MEALLSVTKTLPPESTLIVFDIDQTLSIPDNGAFQRPNYVSRRAILKAHSSGWDRDLRAVMTNLMMVRATSLPIEASTCGVIQQLQAEGYRVIALTGTLTGRTLGFSSIEERRAQQLAGIGISFRCAFPERGFLAFDALRGAFGESPTFWKGILLANGSPKSEVLLAFFDRVGWRPGSVVFVEDTKANLEEMEEALAQEAFAFYGFHYTGADSYDAAPISDEAFEEEWLALCLAARERLASLETAN